MSHISDKSLIVPVLKEGYGLSESAVGNSVSALRATSHPDGLRIDLSWTNPGGATHIKILRRLQAFPYDLTEGTEIYSGVAVTEYEDSSDLDPLAYYYYLVAVSLDGGVTFEYEPSSRVFQLSIPADLNGKDYLWSQIPSAYKEEDAFSGSLMEKLIDVLGSGLNTIRSRINAIKLLNDPDKSPLHKVVHQIASLGFEPELSFDYNTSRRALAAIVGAYKEKGDEVGLLEFVRFFVGWDAALSEFGIGSEARVFRTFGGEPEARREEGTATALGHDSLTDDTKTWETDQWAGGRLIDAAGNVLPVESNTSTTLTFGPARLMGELETAVAAGATFLPIGGLGWFPDSSIQLTDPSDPTITESRIVTSVSEESLEIDVPLLNAYPIGSLIQRQLTKPMMDDESVVNGSFERLTSGLPDEGWNLTHEPSSGSPLPLADVWESDPVNPAHGAKSLKLKPFSDGSTTGWAFARSEYFPLLLDETGKITVSMKLRMEPDELYGASVQVVVTCYDSGGSAVIGGGSTFTDATIGTEWTTVEVERQVTGTVGEGVATQAGIRIGGTGVGTVWIDDVRVTPNPFPSAGPYIVTSGEHSELYDSVKRHGLRGGLDDPFQYFYGGEGSILAPSFGLGDVGVYILNKAEALGTIDVLAPTQLESASILRSESDYFTGMWLNPNRNQTRMFRITASSEGLVVAGGVDLTQYASEGDYFFILTERDALRYARLVKRIQEFAPYNTKLYVFFE